MADVFVAGAAVGVVVGMGAACAFFYLVEHCWRD